MEQAVEICRGAIAGKGGLTIAVVNAAKLVNMRHDPALREAVRSAGLILADGIGVVWASRLLGAPLPERVTGIDLFLELLELADRERLSVYFLGAKTLVLEDMLRRVRERHVGLRVAGHRDGYFGAEEAEEVAHEISAADADILFVGISTPNRLRRK